MGKSAKSLTSHITGPDLDLSDLGVYRSEILENMHLSEPVKSDFNKVPLDPRLSDGNL